MPLPTCIEVWAKDLHRNIDDAAVCFGMPSQTALLQAISDGIDSRVVCVLHDVIQAQAHVCGDV